MLPHLTHSITVDSVAIVTLTISDPRAPAAYTQPRLSERTGRPS